MAPKEKELIIEFCKNNLHIHTDWVGTRVETISECESVEKFVDNLFNYIEQ